MRIAAFAVFTLVLFTTPALASGAEGAGESGPLGIIDVLLRPGAARTGLALLSAIGAMRWFRRRNHDRI